MTGHNRCQVAIAGAGPVGTVMATLLAQEGISVIVLETGADCAQDLRASTFHPPTLEMLDRIGITRMLLDRGLKAPVFHWRDRASGEVIAFDLSEIADVTRYPFRIQCEQYHLSRALAEGLAQLPHADIRFNSRLLTFRQDEAGVDLWVETMTGVETIRADYLIGADGANSIVRKWLGIEFDGFTYPERFLTLSTEVELADYLPNLAYVNYVSDPAEWLVLLRVPSLWRVLVPVNGDVDETTLRSDANKNAIFDRITGDGASVETRHRTLYRVHQRVAKSFREGRVMLIGDSAHLNNPLGGFGMNSGIHDAFNLFDKLAPAITGNTSAEAGLALFDRQRRTVTHTFTQTQTRQNMEFIRGNQDNAHEARRRAMLDILADDDKRRAYMLRQAMFESLDLAAQIA
ncbi:MULTISPECIES: NAD(P)/FAD-dependent oxidoreductase [unclassified Novosphingobium]|uniref:FAD-dependent oxidoreductase n=1 Tax=unclassified Novosphingobium TaxID=2644732 RepID=UPI0003B42011|nr:MULTISPECIES: FAD-dependent monooxygenase [unclassified Novosphingobium]KPF54872.1 monooxygenase [Novosphingobium sp. AAP1]MBB3358293.1 3-(3-hydroxy-phenyl)propionate hydroxylase [Novosphingobium sp. BK256]MBB3374654.1 3-(3-hydroxy-phenyl)propionate hydroxylase [Novosphingobium sp. BK280]MBB3379066.1 3-(3-hydroxy-phenyl)propionate hydroxylase [Novosphingobium sp. BK258]MBB3420760.1 3-(3-hydroxy-phenyl)propionate hydroxylase [Novosphingobium sp. BK267]